MLVFHVKYLSPELDEDTDEVELEENDMTVVGCCFEHTVERVAKYLFEKYEDEYTLVAMHVIDAVTELEEEDGEEESQLSDEEWAEINRKMNEEKEKHNKEKKDKGSGGGRNYPNGGEYIQ